MASEAPIRILHLQPGHGARELSALPSTPPALGFYWISCTRSALPQHLASLQAALQACAGQQLVDLHVSDLLNAQLPSRYDYTTHYDLLVFRRLTTGPSQSANTTVDTPTTRRSGPPVLHRIDTSPVGFALFDQVLLSIHPEDCAMRSSYSTRLLAAQATDPREGRSGGAGARLPDSPADLMLRAMNLIVDGFLDLRRELSRQLDHWQTELLRPHTRFSNWGALLSARLTLHELDDVCEDQRGAVQDWIEALETWQADQHALALRELDLLQVRSRDLLEHIERVAHHVHRLEQNTETAVQMHFSVQSNRTNDIMRTLTVLTAVFLPLNLIAGIFGMNFDALPLIHQQNGFWLAMGAMAVMALALTLLFWRKRYLARTGQG